MVSYETRDRMALFHSEAMAEYNMVSKALRFIKYIALFTSYFSSHCTK